MVALASMSYSHGFQTVCHDALVHHLTFPRVSHRIKFSAVLLIEVITINSVQLYTFTKEQLEFNYSHADSGSTIS